MEEHSFSLVLKRYVCANEGMVVTVVKRPLNKEHQSLIDVGCAAARLGNWPRLWKRPPSLPMMWTRDLHEHGSRGAGP